MSLVKVRYKGVSDVREMSKRDLAAAGVDVDGMLRWERSNGWAVHIKDPSERLLELFKEEGTFTVEEVDAETGKSVQTFVTASKTDDTGSTVVDGTTGQRSTAPSATTPTGQTGRGRST